MKSDEPHSLADSAADALHRTFSYLVMRHVTPPDEYVGFCERFLAQTLLRVVKAGELNDYVLVLHKILADCRVHSLRIYFRDFRLAFLVAVFVPDKYTYHFVTSDIQRFTFSADLRMYSA